MLLGRLVDVGTELFAMAATCSRAQSLVGSDQTDPVLEIADFFCRESRRRIESAFRDAGNNNDPRAYRLARSVLDGKYAWLEDGIVAGAGENDTTG
jgi:hypothetical protein